MRDGPILLLGVLYVKRDECPELAEGVSHPCSIWYAVLKQEAPKGWTQRERIQGASIILKGENHGAVTDTTSVGRAGI